MRLFTSTRKIKKPSGFSLQNLADLCPKMELDNDDTTEINSYFIKNVKNTDMLELSKKRKLSEENLFLPSPKHICNTNHTAVGSSETESGKGSNSLATDNESLLSSSSSSNCANGICDAKYSNQLELVCSDYGIPEIEEFLCSNTDGKNPTNAFVLSSGRWSVGQDSEQDERKPTIDQEFEQYFSRLML